MLCEGAFRFWWGWLSTTICSWYALHCYFPNSGLIHFRLLADQLLAIDEHKQLGYSDSVSVILAVERTGSVISTAGLIMSCAFGGLMLSQTLILAQFGFVLCFGVLLDTFLLRTVLVPAVLTLAGPTVAWWPGGGTTAPKAKQHAAAAGATDGVMAGHGSMVNEQQRQRLLNRVAGDV